MLLAQEWGPPAASSPALFRHVGADHPAAQIDLLLVAEEARRRGIGRLLIKAVAQSARSAGCRDLALTVTDATGHLETCARETGFAHRGAASLPAACAASGELYT